jgi:predicted Fe-S protein YdhL (DUF1289 family)
LACSFSRPEDPIELLLDSDTEKKTILVKNGEGRLSIHVACGCRSPEEVIRWLLDSDTEKETILEKDDRGCLAIHVACGCRSPEEVIRWLLDSDAEKTTILEKDDRGCLPIHVACSHRSPEEVIRWLLDSDTEKETVLEKDDKGRSPIHIACSHRFPAAVIRWLLDRWLLEASIRDRIEQLGLAEWKIGMEKLVKRVTAGDSNTKTIDQIHERLSKCEMERAVLSLALAVWRTSCMGVTSNSNRCNTWRIWGQRMTPLIRRSARESVESKVEPT